jgi:hypothetical protein
VHDGGEIFADALVMKDGAIANAIATIATIAAEKR